MTSPAVPSPTAPPPAEQPDAYAAAPAALKARMDGLLGGLTITDTHAVLSYGIQAQNELTGVSEKIIQGVRNKDIGPTGERLNDVVLQIRGFDLSDLKGGSKPGFFMRLLGAVTPVAKAIQRYETVSHQIEAVRLDLEKHMGVLMRDIIALDHLYDAAKAAFSELDLYIAAGDEQLRRLDEDILPGEKAAAEASADALAKQTYADMVSARNTFERRLHDLRLTRQIVLQSMPTVRLVQDNDKNLIAKIQTAVSMTIPLWKQQVAQAVTIARAAEAGKAVSQVTDLTSEMLQKNAEMLQQSNADIRREVERGVVDVEAVERANASLVATIEESLTLFEEGQRARREAQGRLEACENDLNAALTQARENQQAV